MNQANILSGRIQVAAFLIGGLILFQTICGSAFAKETQAGIKRVTPVQKQKLLHKSHKKNTIKKSPKQLKRDKKIASKKSYKRIKSHKQSMKFPLSFDATLQEEVKKYLGVPYRYGGNTIKGMDCSGFVKRIYSERFDIDLPHQASQQFSSPKLKKISSHDLQAGDLIFFSARKKRINHVGIYLYDDKFIHAIHKKGITVSSLNSDCWQSKIIGAKRLKRTDVLKETSTNVLSVEGDLTLNESKRLWLHPMENSSAYIN